ncbi:MAG TPA: ankyrin repeat domain-containing protein [Candidatus Babeliales bacterium]|jgi:hypothetical protein|nr:ankyrin repeat domain-containing protein [Candidatus Babeliales bacterium]
MVFSKKFVLFLLLFVGAYVTCMDLPEGEQLYGELRTAISIIDRDTIGAMVHSKKYNIFELFNNDSIEPAFQAMTERQIYTTDFDNILAVLPIENGENKNRAVQYMSKYDDLSVLSNLLEKGYLKVDEEYGHKCTLLHYAALRGCRKLTDELIKKGADIHAVNIWGKQPVDYAYRFEQDHCDLKWTFLWRGTGVIKMLRDQCDKKHILRLKGTPLCSSTRRVWDEFSPEEAAWLRNSCTYSISLAQ